QLTLHIHLPDICTVQLVFFFFSSRRRHTRSKRDWSSDVCSSDLTGSDPICRFARANRQIGSLPVAERKQAGMRVGEARSEVAARSEERRVGKESRSGWARAAGKCERSGEREESERAAVALEVTRR